MSSGLKRSMEIRVSNNIANKAKEYYDEVWKDRLYKQLGPAVDQLIGNLADDNPKVRDLAIAKVFKYTGHDIDRKEINATVTEIKVGFSSDE